MNILNSSKWKFIILLLILAVAGIFVFVKVHTSDSGGETQGQIQEDILDAGGESYEDILEGFREYAMYIINDDVQTAWDEGVFVPSFIDETNDYDWWCMQAELSIWHYRRIPKEQSSFGYALEDLNGDGSDELILLLIDYSVPAIFTTAGGEVRLVDAYWPKHDCVILDDGTLYTHTSAGAPNWSSRIEYISPESGELEVLEECGCDGPNGYYTIVDGEFCYVEDIPELGGEYPERSCETTKNSGIVFIPLFGQ